MQTRIRVLKQLDVTLGRLLAALAPAGNRGNAARLGGVKQLLFVRPGGIGDAVLLGPAILALREHYPELIIHLLAERRNAAVFSLCPAVSRVFRYDVPSELAAALRHRHDCVIDTEQWHRLSAVVTRFTRASQTIGFDTNERGRLFTHPVPYSHEDSEEESFMHLLTPLGISSDSGRVAKYLAVPPEAATEARRLLGKLADRPYIVIFPGASIPERQWGAERFSRVAARLTVDGLPVVVVGAGEDVEEGERILSGSHGLNLTGRTSLTITAAVLAGARCLVSGDSGVLHIGVGLGIPTVSLFGPGIAAKWAPRGERHRVISLGLSCSPCTRFGATPACPHGVRCLRDIEPEAVYGAVRDLLGSAGVEQG